MTHTHFIGIGGTGLSAIARVLLERGQSVSGSDRQHSSLAERLETLGARVYIGHAAEQVNGADMVVRSSAIPDDNPEVMAARAKGIPVLRRQEYLAQLLEGLQTIAIAGSHGKTTTTAMITWMLNALNQHPGFIAGGEVNNLQTNAAAGRGPLFVIEADEYDYMFWGLSPKLAVVTNMEHDHPDCFPTPEVYGQAFEGFVDRIIPDGTLIACQDDPGSAAMLAYARAQGKATIGYSLKDKQADYYTENIQTITGNGIRFACAKNGQVLTQCTLQVPGEHNVSNALAALIVADMLKLDLNEASVALSDFRGAGRRFDIKGEASGVTVIDDYGHHPTEIKATLAAARAKYPEHRLWAVWQPHTYSRTQQLMNQFSRAFIDADQVLVTDVYAAREEQPDDFSLDEIINLITPPQARHSSGLDQTTNILQHEITAGDVVIVFSAGDADQVSANLVAHLRQREGQRD